MCAHVLTACLPGWTPLMSACENNSFAFAQWAVSRGADVNAAMSTGEDHPRGGVGDSPNQQRTLNRLPTELRCKNFFV